MVNSKKSPKKSDNAFWHSVAGALASFILLVALIYTIIHGLGFTADQHDSSQLDGLYTQLAIALSFVTMALLIYLLVRYFEVYFITRSSFSLGLIVLVWSLMLLGILTNPLFQQNAGFTSVNGAFVFLPHAVELLAALVLIYLARK